MFLPSLLRRGSIGLHFFCAVLYHNASIMPISSRSFMMGGQKVSSITGAKRAIEQNDSDSCSKIKRSELVSSANSWDCLHTAHEHHYFTPRTITVIHYW
jgi:hypothetical protein